MVNAKSILVTGGTVMDQIIKVPALPQPNEIVAAKKIVFEPGGNGANVAVALSRLGEHVMLYSQIGKDANGETLVQHLERENIDIRGLKRASSGTTGSCIIMVDEEARRVIITLPGLHVLQDPGDISPIPFNDLDALVFAHSYAEVDLQIIKENKGFGLPVITMPGPAIMHGAFDTYVPVVKLSDIVVMNELEAKKATRSKDLNEALASLSKLGPQIIITCGEKGILFSEHDHVNSMEAFSPLRILDSTGAGDAFLAGFVHAYLCDVTTSEAIIFGQAAAAIKIASLGAQKGLATTQQIKRFLLQKGVKLPDDLF
ncbi:MAG: carbohydrate kinase family protein [Candidatus Ranarchaeia archaeon]